MSHLLSGVAQGFKVKSTCLVCGVTLCNVIRYGEKTCFEMFHETEEINDPCRVDGTPAKVKRVAHNLVQPPSRRRNIADEPNARGRQLQL